MSGRVGSITTDIIADGLIFNMDAANRASTIPSTNTIKTFNTLNTSISGSIITDSTWTDSSITPSFDFDGTDGYINCGNPIILQITGNLSISAWVKFNNATAGSDWFLAKDDNGGGAGRSYMLNRLTSGKIRFAIQRSSLKSVQSSTTISSDTWYYIVGINDGTDLKVYINGSLDNTAAGDGGTIDNGNSNFTLGANEIPGGYLSGNISNAQIYNRALSANEVLHNYNALKGRFGL